MDVLMPQLGETVAEGKITKWFKSAGDKVQLGDNLFEIETDKVSMEVPTIEAGVLAEIRVPAGEVASVGAVVAGISADGKVAATGPAPAAAKPQTAPALAPPLVPASTIPPPSPRAPVALDPFREVRTPERNYGPARLASGTPVTPLARRLAAESGIDLGGVSPTGPHGRIVARDIVSAVGPGRGRPPAAAGMTPPAARSPPQGTGRPASV